MVMYLLITRVYIECTNDIQNTGELDTLAIDIHIVKKMILEELKEVNAVHGSDGRFATKGKGKVYSLTKNAEHDVGPDSELEVPARGRITTHGKISSRYGMNTGDPDKNCGRLTIDGKKKKKTRSCKNYPKDYWDEGQEIDEALPAAIATAARLATKAGTVADKVGKVAGAVKTGSDLVKKVLPDDDEDKDSGKKTEKMSTPGRKKQKRDTERRNRNKNKKDLVPRAVDSPSVRQDKLFGDAELYSLARGIMQEMDDEAEYPRWDKNGKLLHPTDELDERVLEPADEIYVKELIKQNVQLALKQTQEQAKKSGVGCSWAQIMSALMDIETAQKGRKEAK